MRTPTAPIRLIIATANAVSPSSASITGATATTADVPQMDEPTPSIVASLLLKPSALPMDGAMKIPITTTVIANISIDKPDS